MKKRLTDTEQTELLRVYKATRDPEIRATLILHNQTLASWQARKMSTYKLHADDLEQAAMIGVIRALELFEPDKGFKFSTYATVWMRHEIQEFYRKDTTITLSKEDSQMVNAELKHADPSDHAQYLNMVRDTWSLDIPAEFGGHVIQAEAASHDDLGEEQTAFTSVLQELVPKLGVQSRFIIEAKLRGRQISGIAKDLDRSPEYTRQRYYAAIGELQKLADLYAVASPFHV